MRLAHLLIVFALGTTSFAVRAQPGVDSDACSSEVSAVVSAALKHALAEARDLPDLLLVEQNDPAYVSDYLWGTECIISDSVLPSSGRTYELLGQEAARELANERGEPIAFARAGDVKIAESEASLWVGASLQPPQGDARGLTCCCGGQMFLRRESGIWTFVRWGMRGCA